MKSIMLLISVLLVGCTHCPVKEDCHTQIMYVMSGKVLVPIFIQVCDCPVPEVPNK